MLKVPVKQYVTKTPATSITLLSTSEIPIVLESLIYLSKYADLHVNNIYYIREHWIVPKLVELLKDNVPIIRLSLRLLGQIMKTEIGLSDFAGKKYEVDIMKICEFYTSHVDDKVKEYSGQVLYKYLDLPGERIELLLKNQKLIETCLNYITIFAEPMLLYTLKILSKIVQFRELILLFPGYKSFTGMIYFDVFEYCSPESSQLVLYIIEKLTEQRFVDIQTRFKEAQILEEMFDRLKKPLPVETHLQCLKIIKYCMDCEPTNSYIIETYDFFLFCQFLKNCPEYVLPVCSNMLLTLLKNPENIQIFFDLSLEDTILSFFRSRNKGVLNTACECTQIMTTNSFCCDKMVTPSLIENILSVFARKYDEVDTYNIIALTTLHKLSLRSLRTIKYIVDNNGIELIKEYFQIKMVDYVFKSLFDIIIKIIHNKFYRDHLLSESFYDQLFLNLYRFDPIRNGIIGLFDYLLNIPEFRNYIVVNKKLKNIVNLFIETKNLDLTKRIAIFFYNTLKYPSTAKALLRERIWTIIRDFPELKLFKVKVLDDLELAIFNCDPTIKFFETGRLDITDILDRSFYLITGIWHKPFPFIDELQKELHTTKYTVYVVDFEQYTNPYNFESYAEWPISYGNISTDPYLYNYLCDLQARLKDVRQPRKRIKILADLVNEKLSDKREVNGEDTEHTQSFHLSSVKHKLGTNIIPIGYLQFGFYCEKALLFKALADKVNIAATLVKGIDRFYWNEVALIYSYEPTTVVKMFVVDLMNNIGNLLPVGSKDCNFYCNITSECVR